ncbi:hypothetical protein [Streptomyces sp. NRRL WC-3742]|uniref:hypothetical protein n=1 Tax=Streptomyces sp. NRRL WC-3742 TaxID=1463934 RepID=UPI0004C79BFB|nr:hypothetical protein [Streptomyces sp. NRRL WC-3742]
MAERPRRPRALAIALGAALLAGAGGGLWYWNLPPTGIEAPQSACWGALTGDDLRAMTDEGYRSTESQNGSPSDPKNTGAFCTVSERDLDGDTRDRARGLLGISALRQDENGQKAKTKAESGGWAPIRPASLDFGPAAQGWYFDNGTVQLMLRCDEPPPANPSSFPPQPYIEVTVSGSQWTDRTPLTRLHQIRADAAFRVAQALVRDQGCTNHPQLAERPPTVPS